MNNRLEFLAYKVFIHIFVLCCMNLAIFQSKIFNKLQYLNFLKKRGAGNAVGNLAGSATENVSVWVNKLFDRFLKLITAQSYSKVEQLFVIFKYIIFFPFFLFHEVDLAWMQASLFIQNILFIVKLLTAYNTNSFIH